MPPPSGQHLEHVGDLAALADIAEVPTVVVDRDALAERRFQPRKLRRVQNEIIAIGLRIVVRIAAQRVADDVESVVGA